jgi:hypothetical protein
MLISLARSRSHGFMKWSERRWADGEEADQPGAAASIAIAPIGGETQAVTLSSAEDRPD